MAGVTPFISVFPVPRRKKKKVISKCLWKEGEERRGDTGRRGRQRKKLT